MSISGIESSSGGILGTTTQPTALSGLSAGASNGLSTTSSDDYDMFLQLLVAQLKYQDPMNPTDSTQFLSQNAQFTSLQKMEQLTASMGQLVTAQMTFGAAGLIGQQVTYSDATGAVASGTATGVTFSASGPSLTVDGVTVPVSMVISAGNASASATPDSTAPTTPSTDTSL